uniref:Uncharacterized protein n=1 Tax=Anguilla anguilla TaxID=7936 RepID=A0A0E9REK1_ANGAN
MRVKNKDSNTSPKFGNDGHFPWYVIDKKINE